MTAATPPGVGGVRSSWLVIDGKRRRIAVALAGDDQRVDDGGALSDIRMADEEPVFLADGGPPDRIFDEVIVDACERVPLVCDQHVPVVEQVRARFAEFRWGSTFRCSPSATRRNQCSGRAQCACRSVTRFSPTFASSHSASRRYSRAINCRMSSAGLRWRSSASWKVAPA